MSIFKRIIEGVKRSFCRQEVRVVEVGEGKFNVYLQRDAYATLERMMVATGKSSMGETLRAAIEWHEKEKASCHESRIHQEIG